MTVRHSSLLVLLLGIAPGLSAQSAHSGAGPRTRLEGKWQAKTDEEIRNIMVRSDSSAQFGDQVARWRVVGDSLWLTLGDGVWQVYGMKLGEDKLTLSGGGPGEAGDAAPRGAGSRARRLRGYPRAAASHRARLGLTGGPLRALRGCSRRASRWAFG